MHTYIYISICRTYILLPICIHTYLQWFKKPLGKGARRAQESAQHRGGTGTARPFRTSASESNGRPSLRALKACVCKTMHQVKLGTVTSHNPEWPRRLASVASGSDTFTSSASNQTWPEECKSMSRFVPEVSARDECRVPSADRSLSPSLLLTPAVLTCISFIFYFFFFLRWGKSQSLRRHFPFQSGLSVAMPATGSCAHDVLDGSTFPSGCRGDSVTNARQCNLILERLKMCLA